MANFEEYEARKNDSDGMITIRYNRIKKETHRAYLIDTNDGYFWAPKSVVTLGELVETTGKGHVSIKTHLIVNVPKWFKIEYLCEEVPIKFVVEFGKKRTEQLIGRVLNDFDRKFYLNIRIKNAKGNVK